MGLNATQKQSSGIVNNKGVDKPAHLCCLISTFIICSWESIIWASMRENLSLVVCEQHRRIPGCASMQSGQGLCYSLFGMAIICKLATGEISIF